MSIYVTLRDGQFIAATEYTNEILASDPSAATVIQSAIDHAGIGSVVLDDGNFPLDKPVFLQTGTNLGGKGRGTRLFPSAQFDVEAARKRIEEAIREYHVKEPPAELPPGEEPPEIPDSAPGLVIGIGIKSANLERLTIDGQGARICGVSLRTCAECRVRELMVKSCGDAGIEFSHETILSSIDACTSAGNGTSGIRTRSGRRSHWGDFIPNLITGCIVFGGGEGYSIEGTIVLNLVGCIAYQTKGSGFHLSDSSNSVALTGCRTFQITGDAVIIEDSHELNISGCVFCWHSGIGIRVKGCDWGTINGNEVIDTGNYNPEEGKWHSFDVLPEDYTPSVGIELDTVRSFTVTGNSIFNWGVCPPMLHAILETESCSNNVISANAINYVSNDAIRSKAADTLIDANNTHAPEAFRGMFNRLQSFDRKLTRRLIGELV